MGPYPEYMNPEEEEKSPPCPNLHYELHYDSQLNLNVSPLIRYKMMKWVLNESTKRGYTREVFALTSYYLDLYFQKRTV